MTMNKLLEFASRCASTMVVFSVAYALIILIAGKNVLEGSFHGEAWPIFIVLYLIFSIVKGFFKGAYKATCGNTNFVLSGTPAIFLDSILNLIGSALTFFATAALVPHAASYTSAGGILVAAVICGVAFATCDYIDEILKKIFNPTT